MDSNAIQDMIDGMGAREQRRRAATQMTLGEAIAALRSLANDDPERRIAGFECPHSYRGYYVDLAFETPLEPISVSEALAACEEAMGRAYEGYKGGQYVMGELTPIWSASYGCTGLKITGIVATGAIVTLLTEKDEL